ncbi:hypothetical protein ACQPXH_24525 [Nocardia sp. CA-135953]|uniref:hypothetical protein n=1 Tax=Nocardia sp. CA-135953 TaxID=3239978 RepID=UPI003D97373B
MFPSQQGTLRDPRNARKQLQQALDRSHRDTPETPHAARKTVGTHLAEGTDGGQSDIGVAAAQLGNTEAVTRRHYVQRTHQGPDASNRFAASALPDEQRRDCRIEPNMAIVSDQRRLTSVITV